MLYRLANDTFYSIDRDKYIFEFWILKEKITLLSPIKVGKGDIVKIKSIVRNEIEVIPTTEETDEDNLQDLVFLSSYIPINEDHYYDFDSQDCEILITVETVKEGNKSYLLLVGSPVSCQMSKVLGTEKSTKDNFEFIIFKIEESD
jgi:hypothetical protein